MSTTCRCGSAGCGPECRLLTAVGITAAAGLPAARRDRRNLTTGRLILDGPPLPQTPLTSEDLTAAARHISQHRLWPGYTRGDQQRYVADIAATLRDQREQRLRHTGHMVASILRERRAGRGLPPTTDSRAEGPAGPSHRPRGSAPAWETAAESPAAAPARVQHPEPRPPTPPRRPAGAMARGGNAAWVWIDQQALPAAWSRLHDLLDLAATDPGPLQSLTVRPARPGELPAGADAVHRAHSNGQTCWSEILVRPGLNGRRQREAVDHEAGHVAHLLADLAAAGDDWPTAWHAHVHSRNDQTAEQIATHVERAASGLAHHAAYRHLAREALGIDDEQDW